jgi:hypothetical protein
MSATLTLETSEIQALEELFGAETESDVPEAVAELGFAEELGDGPEAIGSVILTVRTYRFRC